MDPITKKLVETYNRKIALNLPVSDVANDRIFNNPTGALTQKINGVDFYDYTKVKSTPTTDATNTLVKTLPAIKGKPEIKQTLHVNDGQHYVVSSNANETLVFPSDKHGNITSDTEVHAGEPPRHGEEGFSISDHHGATFQDFVRNQNKSQSESDYTPLRQKTPHQYGIGDMSEDFDLITGMSTIAPAAIAAGAFALPKILPRVIDRIRDAGKPSIVPIKSSVPPGPVGKLATHRDQDAVNQSNSARQHLEDKEAQLARAEGRRPNPVTDEAVAKLVRSRVSAASGVMTRRENVANPYNLPRPRPGSGNDGY